MKITTSGDVLLKRLSEANVFVYRPASLKCQPARSTRGQSDQVVLTKNTNSSNSRCVSDSAGEIMRGFCGITHPPVENRKYSRFQSSGGDSKLPRGQDGLCFPSDWLAVDSSERDLSQHDSNVLGANFRSIGLNRDKVVKIFDMSKFKRMLDHESRRAHPNRNYLQNQCISVISFVVDDKKMFNLPSWFMIINIVALDLFHEHFGFDLIGPQPFLALSELSTDHKDEPAEGYVINPTDPENMIGTGGIKKFEMNSSFLASKRAFARAAAEGAYNYDTNRHEQGVKHCSEGSDGQANRSDGFKCGRLVSALIVGRGETDNQETMSSLATGKTISSGPLGAEITAAINTNQSSSSSGFNSHCSSQHDSSTASSSSQIATPPSNTEVASSEPRTQGDSCAVRGGTQTDCLPELRTSRGKRPAKLPHRLGHSPARMAGGFISAPIEIPAPPNEPTGTANLILISPTGMSPPTVRGDTNAGEALGYQVVIDTESASVRHMARNHGIPTHDDAVKLPLRRQRTHTEQIPVGIPAHAQLAPPATQRHILRYLMSVSDGRLKEPKISCLMEQYSHREDGTCNAPIKRQVPARPLRKAGSNLGRPLPFLPVQDPSVRTQKLEQMKQQINEGLYYSGYRARTSSNRGQPTPDSCMVQPILVPNYRRPPDVHPTPVRGVCQNLIAGGSNKMSSGTDHYRTMVHATTPLALPSTGNIVRTIRECIDYPFGARRGVESRGQKEPLRSGGNSFVRPLVKLFKTSGHNLDGSVPLEKSEFASVDNLKVNCNHIQTARRGSRDKHDSLWNQLGSAIDSSLRRSQRAKIKSKSTTKL